MVNVTELRWKRYLQDQVNDEEENEDEAIPYAPGDCPHPSTYTSGGLD